MQHLYIIWIRKHKTRNTSFLNYFSNKNGEHLRLMCNFHCGSVNWEYEVYLETTLKIYCDTWLRCPHSEMFFSIEKK